MKKISIMLLAALMLFAFVACDNETKEPEAKTLAFTAIKKADTNYGKYLNADSSIAEGALTAVLVYDTDSYKLPVIANELATVDTATDKVGTFTATITKDADKKALEGYTVSAAFGAQKADNKNVVVVTIKGDAAETNNTDLEGYTLTIKYATKDNATEYTGTLKLTGTELAVVAGE